jgi:copper chaperone CopZ
MSQTDRSREYIVVGMTCQHCALSVTEEVSDVAGAHDVDVDLAAGRLFVQGDASDEAIRAAVVEAGYEVSS